MWSWVVLTDQPWGMELMESFHDIVVGRGGLLHRFGRSRPRPRYATAHGDHDELAGSGGSVAEFAPDLLNNRDFHKQPMLADRWLALCENAGLDGRAGWTALAGAYGDPARAYHNMNHIGFTPCCGAL